MRRPDLVGNGAAWLIKAKPRSRDQDATVRAWLVNGTWHPAWSYWMVAVIHLRDLPGQSRPAVKEFAAATHEFLIVSLASPPSVPETKPDPDDARTLIHLSPPDVAHQFVGTDEEGKKLCDVAVKAIVVSNQSPDSDYRSWWNAAVPRTLEHIRFGRHPE